MGGARKVAPDLLAYARAMRRKATDAEALVWRLVRAKALGVRFRRQHPVDRFILDFYCPQARLAVELDGGQHFETQQVIHDTCREQLLAEQGIRVLRLKNDDVLKKPEDALEAIWRAVQCTDTDPK